jgi:biotin transport system substrate-specific component
MNAASASRPLVDHILPEQGAARHAAVVGMVLLGAAILWASAKISVPFYPVPMSMQTFAVLLLAAAYGARLGVATVLLYLAQGALGLPVFQGTPQAGLGLHYMVGPTGGYLVGFVVATAVVGALAERGFDRDPLRLFGAMLLGEAVIFLFGFAWLAWFALLPNGGAGVGIGGAFAGGVAPFLLGDLVKVALAAGLVSATGRLVRRQTG